MYRTLTIIVTAASMAACSSLVPLSQVTSAETKWNRSKIQNYDYVVQVNAQSPDTDCSPGDRVEVRVRHGQTLTFGTCKPDAEMALAFGSIPKLFETIRATRSKRPPRYLVKFDAELGYPKYIDANYSRTMTDYSVRYFIRDFRRAE